MMQILYTTLEETNNLFLGLMEVLCAPIQLKPYLANLGLSKPVYDIQYLVTQNTLLLLYLYREKPLQYEYKNLYNIKP